MKEKDITLTISLKVAELLKAKGLEVILTRTTDRYIDLTPERTPKCDLSISIHVNAGGGQGLETWVSLYNQSAKSRKLGQSIQNNILKLVPFTNRGLRTRANSKNNADYLYMLRQAKGVPVLVECGFIDNTVDANILKNSSNLVKIAEGIANGVFEYLGIKEDSGMFKDVPKEHWAAESIDKLSKLGILKGDDNGNFRPNDPITRAETAVVIDRVLKYLGR